MKPTLNYDALEMASTAFSITPNEYCAALLLKCVVMHACLSSNEAGYKLVQKKIKKYIRRGGIRLARMSARDRLIVRTLYGLSAKPALGTFALLAWRPVHHWHRFPYETPVVWATFLVQYSSDRSLKMARQTAPLPPLPAEVWDFILQLTF